MSVTEPAVTGRDQTDLCYLSATSALAAFRSGDLSPVELMSAVISRAERIEGEVNAFAERDFATALEQARHAEERYLRGRARPLEGLPIALKEEQPIAGRPLREGSVAFRDNIADVTHPVVERVVAAGGIAHARTTTPELCAAGFTQSSLWGVTRNPWNTEYSSGGSSGGSGAALAAGTATLATGSDIAGSIRIPASFNGVVGYKPPYGRVPGLSPFNLDHFCHDGPMARTVADCALLQNVIAGQDPRDPVSLPSPPVLPSVFPAVEGLRIAFCMHLGDYPVEPDVRRNTRAAVDLLREAGAMVEEIELPWTRAEVMRCAWAHYGAVFAGIIDEETGSGEAVEPYTRDLRDRARAAHAEVGYHGGLKLQNRFHRDLAEVFTRFDALLTPTSGIRALRAGEDYVERQVVVDGIALDHHLEAPLTVPFNIASRCPVLSVPSGTADDGVPTGLQIVGRPYDEATVFRIGATAQTGRYEEGARPRL